MVVKARRAKRAPKRPSSHRTIDRATQIVEQVAYHPGMSFADLVRAVGAARSSVHGFVSGLLKTGWLYQHDGGYYLGPTIYGLTLASGHLPAGFANFED